MRELMKERIGELVSMHHTTVNAINDITEGAATRVRNYYDGLQHTIRLEDIVTLADYFGVSIDYLIGRTDELDPDYFKKAEELHLNSYETYLGRKRHEVSIPLDVSGNSSPYPIYPYNLIKTFKLPLEVPVADQVKQNLEEVILTKLSKREALCVELYFKKYKTLDECGMKFGVTRERIRQILAKAGRKLRHPSIFKFIEYGIDYQDRINEEYSARLDEFIKEGAKKRFAVHKFGVGSEIPIIDLEFSVRTFNCLSRKGIKTVGDLEKLSLTEILNIRNLGRKSFNEICAKVPSIAERNNTYDWEATGKSV